MSEQWAVAYTCAGGALRVNTEHTSRDEAVRFMQEHVEKKTAGLDLMAPWWLLPPGTYNEASWGGRYDEVTAELLYGRLRDGDSERKGVLGDPGYAHGPDGLGIPSEVS